MNELVKVDLKPKFAVFNDNCVYVKKITQFDITTPNDDTISIEKWIVDSDMETDNGWEFLDDESKEIYNALSEELQDKFYDFISELKL